MEVNHEETYLAKNEYEAVVSTSGITLDKE